LVAHKCSDIEDPQLAMGVDMTVDDEMVWLVPVIAWKIRTIVYNATNTSRRRVFTEAI